MTTRGNSARKEIATGLFWGGLLVAAAGLIYFAAVSRSYRATATVRVWKTGDGETNQAPSGYDPDSTLPGECELIRSQAILDPAIQRLGLNTNWGNRYNQGVPLQTADTRQRLREMISATPVPNSAIVSVSVTGADPLEIAAIANEIVRGYLGYHAAQRAELSREAVGSLSNQMTQLDGKITLVGSNLVRLARGINYDQPANSPKFLSPELYQTQQSNRAALQEKFDEQNGQIERLKVLAGQPLLAAAAALEDPTNRILTPTLRQLDQARSNLAQARTGHGADSPEVRQAETVVNGLEDISQQTARSLLGARKAELAGLRAEIDSLNQQLKNITTNSDEFVGLHPEYQETLREFQGLKAAREQLQERMKLDDSREAVLPLTLSTQAVDDAVPPAKPSAPNSELALALVTVGVLAAGASFCLPKARLAA